MWAVIDILAVSAAIAMMEIPPLWRRKMRKEIGFFSVFLLIGAALSIAQSLRITLPNPLDWITAMCKPISDAISSSLQ